MPRLLDDTTAGRASRVTGCPALHAGVVPHAVVTVDGAAGLHLDEVLTAESLDAFRQWATTTPVEGLDAAALLDRARAIEELSRALVVVAGETAMAFDQARREQDAPRGIDPERTRKAVVSELALARRVSPWRAGRDLSTALVAVPECWHTWAALRAGDITPASVAHVLKATAMLDREDRSMVDEALHRGPDDIPPADGRSALRGMGDKQIEATARRLAYDLDPASVMKANAIAESERYVAIRPRPDCMVQLTAVVPLAAGVAAYAGLVRAADAAKAAGDERGRAQVMADTFVARLTATAAQDAIGTDPVGATTPAPTPVALTLVMTEATLHTEASTPATLVADGITPTPVPAPLARRLAQQGSVERIATRDAGGRIATLTDRTGRPVPTESTGRTFPDGLATLVALRDQTCSTPWCASPIRHTDHITAWADGGPTTLANATGRCEHCNHAKQHPDWHERPTPTGKYTITTPTGQHHTTSPPPLLRSLWPQGRDWWEPRATPTDLGSPRSS